MMEAIVPRKSRAGSGSSSTSIAKVDDPEHVREVETGWVKEELDSGEIVAIRDPHDFPDGGIQAWSVCVGVCVVFYILDASVAQRSILTGCLFQYCNVRSTLADSTTLHSLRRRMVTLSEDSVM